MRSIKLFFSITIATIAYSCNQTTSNYTSGSAAEQAAAAIPKTPEQLRTELRIKELAEPTTYLTSENVTMSENRIQTRKEGLFRSAEYKTEGWIVSGTINNSATLAKFKDIVLNIKLFSQTGTVIEDKDYTVYEFFNPNSQTPFSIKTFPHEATDKFSLTVKTAVPAN